MTRRAAGGRLPIAFVLLCLTLDAMGIGLILPVMPALIEELTGGGIGEAALWGGVLSAAFAVMQFLFGPLLGSLSDRWGRRPVLLVSLAVMTADYVVMALAGSIWLLLLTRVVGGITAATMSTANAFIADISDPEEKAARFGLAGAAFGVGFVLGPAIGGVLGELGTRAPFWAAAALGAANLALGLLVMPETVRRPRPFSLRGANPLGALAALGGGGGGGRSGGEGVRLFLGIVFLYEFAFIVYPATWAYFGPAAFGWTPGTVGLSLTLFGVSLAVVQGGLIRVALCHLGERGTVLWGLVFNAGIFAVLGVLGVGWIALALTPVTGLGAVVTPALQGLMSRRMAEDRQGELQGAITSARALAAVFSPFAMTALFWWGEARGLPGLAFLLSSALIAVCLLLWTGRRRAAAARPDGEGRGGA
ncbi:DHA1 family tetracycline resistance protein-like MFS transporter [Hasllibacter halocynthiae]|uniref:DHA1 family tetracycline resistance protein-like MFS transporter n=1 Tax=Hasllibacter halocynthiae TaxID=595589 RepID=A0A2T0X1X0_9RHOB|nr:MFS transporter [Hasllibacter halocynthiae]PRY92946.1 DHA1 family tetracycline resistance protein-like MFS transporter [Hasllibacter halocynthiae]